MESTVVIIAGMHRSGTSLSGSLLEQSGLFIGDNLLSNGFDNKKGHFEDVEILNIHEKDLKLKNLDSRGLKGDIEGDLKFEQESHQPIDALLTKRNSKIVWGWKEPRTTLYLQAWKEKLPNLKVIAVYRDYDEVENSLLRRYRYKLKYGTGIGKLARLKHISLYPVNVFFEKYNAYKAWYVYNNNILKFKNQFPNDTVIVELNHFLKHYNDVIAYLNKKFEINLKTINVNNFFEESLLKKQNKKGSRMRMFSKKRLEILLHKLNENALWI